MHKIKNDMMYMLEGVYDKWNTKRNSLKWHCP